jgi:nucleotide-binding universal stress UspA family protein
VLAAIDATTAAEEVLRLAASVSAGSELFAVHAFHVPFEGFVGEEAVYEDVENDHVTAVRALVERVLPSRSSRKVHIHVREGDALPVLSRAIDELHPDLMVLGSHVRGPVSRLLTGSVSELAISSLETDLLILKTKAEDSITSL